MSLLSGLLDSDMSQFIVAAAVVVDHRVESRREK